VKPLPTPWWTEADEAELAVVVWELVTGYEEHKALDCPGCASPGPCPQVREAVEAAVDWARKRHLVSRGQLLRERQADLEALLRILGREDAD
jgi:hypothetical protein